MENDTENTHTHMKKHEGIACNGDTIKQTKLEYYIKPIQITYWSSKKPKTTEITIGVDKYSQYDDKYALFRCRFERY